MPERRTLLLLLNVSDKLVVLGLGHEDPVARRDVVVFCVAVARPGLRGNRDEMADGPGNAAFGERMQAGDGALDDLALRVELSIHREGMAIAQRVSRSEVDEVTPCRFRRGRRPSRALRLRAGRLAKVLRSGGGSIKYRRQRKRTRGCPDGEANSVVQFVPHRLTPRALGHLLGIVRRQRACSPAVLPDAMTNRAAFPRATARAS